MAYFLQVRGVVGFFDEFSIQIICLFMPLHLLLVFSPVNMPRVCAKEMLDEVNSRTRAISLHSSVQGAYGGCASYLWESSSWKARVKIPVFD